MKRVLMMQVAGLFFALQPAAAQPVPRYERVVSPFPVRDTAGVPYQQPFLGGFDVPRPQLVDIDGDGDLDLFVQERSNAVMFFENREGKFVWQTDRFMDLPVGEWYRFADVDRDGVVDLLSESPISYIRVWRNVGSAKQAEFRIAADTLKDNDGAPIPADRQNILNLVDVDCNGRMDLFLGRVAGTVDRFEAVPGTERNGIPRFVLHTERFEGIEVLGPVPGQPGGIERTGTRHGANTLAFGDVDGDGDPDLFWGDYFERGLLLFNNEAPSCGATNMKGRHIQFPDSVQAQTSGYNAPATGDVDGNGFMDVVMGVIGGAYSPRKTSIQNLFLISQQTKGTFAVTTRRLIPTLDVGNESIVALGDLDNDGDVDAVIGSKISTAEDDSGTLTWFENTGSAAAPTWRERGLLSAGGEFHLAPVIVDIDGDNKQDLLVGTWKDRVQWWSNGGTPAQARWTLRDSALVTLTRGSNTTPALADIDGDGDLDLFVGEASGQMNYYRNSGSRTEPRFTLVSDVFQGIDVGRRSTPTLADMNGDGRVDLLLGGEDGGVELWWNDSSADSVRFVRAEGSLLNSPPYSSAAAADLDGDGVPELIVGTQSGGVLFYRRVGAR